MRKIFTRKTADQIKTAGGGRFDRKTFESFTEADVERRANKDGEDEFLPSHQEPTRISRPFQPVEQA